MTAERSIFLFKAARRPLYRKENLTLLAAERGSVVDVAYNRTWVAPALQGADAFAPGTQVRVVFADRPYTHFVPVRTAEVLEAAWDELTLRLRLVLGNWIGLESMEPTEFAERLRTLDPGGVPANRFVAVGRDDIAFRAYYGDHEDEGWRRVVDHVLTMSAADEDRPYHGSVFFRPVGVRVDGELLVARRIPLPPGTRASLVLGFHNPHLSESDVGRYALRVLAPEDSVHVEVPERFPAVGEIEVPFEVRGDDVTLTVENGAMPAEHTSLTLRFGSGFRTEQPGGPSVMYAIAPRVEAFPEAAAEPLVSALEEATDAATAGASREALLRLYEVVFRNAEFEPSDALDVLDAFDPLLPGEQRLAERRALLLAALDDAEGAWNVLRTLDPELMGDEARFLFFRLHAERDGGKGLLQRVLALELTAEGRFPRLVETLETLPPRTLAHLVPRLVEELPAEQLRDLIVRVGSRLESPDALAETANNLYLATGDAQWAFNFLDTRRRQLRLADSAIVDALVELAAAGGHPEGASDLLEETARRIGNLIERDQLDDALMRLRQVTSGMNPAERERLYHAVADRLARRGDPARAAEVMVEFAYGACAAGDLETATDAVERAVGLWALVVGRLASGPVASGGGAGAGIGRHGGSGGCATNGAGPAPESGSGMDAMPPWLADAVAAVREAWEGVADLVEWRRDADDRRREALRARYLNRRILIAGGRRQPEWIERLRDYTGAEVDWAERYRDEGDDLSGFAERIRQRHYDLVVYVLQKSGHEVQYRLRPACAEAGVPWVATTSAGWRGVLEAVEGA